MLVKQNLKTALIGYTGFVGSNIYLKKKFTDLYNSKNIQSIRNKSYDLVVCAGSRASKWLINQNPQADSGEIARLVNNLRSVKARKFVLISTVDIYPDPRNADEGYLPSISSHESAYGKNRLELEGLVKRLFKNALILRLPALFGPGLKKNFIFDLIHDKMLDWTNINSEFQFYNLDNIWRDILFGLHCKLDYMNITSEPVSCSEIVRHLGMQMPLSTKNSPVYYDLRSKYSCLRGINDGYFYHKSQIIPELLDFIIDEKRKLK